MSYSWLEACCGTSAVSLLLLHSATPPVSRRGSKSGYAGVILELLSDFCGVSGRPKYAVMADADAALIATFDDIANGAPLSRPILEHAINDRRKPEEVWREAKSLAAESPGHWLLWSAGARGGDGGFKGSHIRRPSVDGFIPNRVSLLRRINKLAAYDWDGVHFVCRRLGEFAPDQFDVVYIDPPYEGRLGYSQQLEPGELYRFVEHCRGVVAISEAQELPRKGLFSRFRWLDVSDMRTGQTRRSLTTDDTELLGIYDARKGTR